METALRLHSTITAVGGESIKSTGQGRTVTVSVKSFPKTFPPTDFAPTDCIRFMAIMSSITTEQQRYVRVNHHLKRYARQLIEDKKVTVNRKGEWRFAGVVAI